MSSRVLITVSGRLNPDRATDVSTGGRPRADFDALAERLRADLVDYSAAERHAGRVGRVVRRIAGDNGLLAWTCFRMRGRYDAILTDGEQVGIPYAAMAWFGRRRGRPKHEMIVHIMSVRKKRLLFNALVLRRRIDRLFVYCTAQRDFAVSKLRIDPSKVTLTSFMVDGDFFRADRVATEPRRMIATAGLERRDYRTLVEAVRGLPVEVVIAAASPWSKQGSRLEDVTQPENVTVCRLDHFALRQVYAESLFVVMPLEDVDFQAGVTTILEAMAMSKAVICTRTRGQTDVIIDGETGVYVRPGDPDELRNAIVTLLEDPEQAARLGIAGRQWVEQHADIGVYAARLAAAVNEDLSKNEGTTR